ncbi:sarcosine oxidase-like protein [Amylocarpus encephaloides]|uniref:Sarcosine oxidase-like protein n=1 Tax=Amylocarpus encephaloides TaxID=45428 RepID=A0A9P7YHV1_9HELO|nr:sarcosine oxidase-like protein [Amylocarpus encephaloides]
MISSKQYSHIIVGSGAFGASTAYHLSKSHPQARIALVDRSPSFPSPLAASHDFNKIVRADYGNTFYCGLALEARVAWMSDPLYTPFYHQSGLVNIEDTGLGRRIIDSYVKHSDTPGALIISPEELKGRYNGLYNETNYNGVSEIYFNPVSRWAEATPAVNAVVEASRAYGVELLQGDVESLLFDEHEGCSGILLKDGRKIEAEKVILSTGASTAKLLAQSAPKRTSFQSGDRITAAAVVTGIIKLDSDQMSEFKDSPVLIHDMKGVMGQVLPPTLDGLLKFCVDVSFKNSVYHEPSSQTISSPPDTHDQDQHNIPNSLRFECQKVVQDIFGMKLVESHFDSLRIFWDGITPNQEFIISRHSRCANLYIATGGSFHGWKFLPIVGKYVTQLLDDKLSDSLQARWAWDRDQQGDAHEKIVPRRELADLL